MGFWSRSTHLGGVHSGQVMLNAVAMIARSTSGIVFRNRSHSCANRTMKDKLNSGSRPGRALRDLVILVFAHWQPSTGPTLASPASASTSKG